MVTTSVATDGVAGMASDVVTEVFLSDVDQDEERRRAGPIETIHQRM